MILCITPNVAVDRTLLVPDFKPGGVSRAVEVIVAAGGKGINVARAIRIFGEEAVCAGFLGGHSGRLVADLAAQEGLKGSWTWIEGETRTCVIVIKPNDDDATVINEPGPTISGADWSRLRRDVLQQAGQAECVCLSGSLPLGAPAGAPADLIQAVRETGRPIWVDTSKAALRAAMSAQPAGLKVNAVEVGDVLGRKVHNVETAFAAAAEIQRFGIRAVVLTLGRAGAVLATEAGRWWAQPPEVEIVSSVGSGDVFLAGLVTGLVAGAPPAEALRRAVAAGTANALQAGGGAFSLPDFEAVLARTRVR